MQSPTKLFPTKGAKIQNKFACNFPQPEMNDFPEKVLTFGGEDYGLFIEDTTMNIDFWRCPFFVDIPQK